MTFKRLSASGALALAWGLLPAYAQSCPDQPAGSPPALPLEAAIQRALQSDLRPEAARGAVSAARTERAIANLKPADTVSLDFENFPGIGIASETDNLELTARFSRVWERGGKREARTALADRQVDVASAGVAITQADIAFEIRSLYIDIALLNDRLSLARERLSAAQAAEDLIQRRVDAARDPLLAGARAVADRKIAEGDVVRLEREATALSQALADFWSGDVDFAIPSCTLPQPDTHGAHPGGIDNAPELAQIEAERRKADAAVRAAQADRTADITWSAGVRKFGFDESVGVVGGISIPLGAPARAAPYEQRAAADTRRLSAEAEALRQSLLRESARLERASYGAIDALAALNTGPIPEAERAVSLANDGYARGAFSYLDVLEAQRLLFGLREQRLDHLRTFHLAEAALARIQAANAPALLPESPQ